MIDRQRLHHGFKTSPKTSLTLFAPIVAQARQFRGRVQGRASTNPRGRKLAIVHHGRQACVADGSRTVARVEAGGS